MRTLIASVLLVVASGFIASAVAGDDEMPASPQVYCVAFHKAGDATCAAIEKAYLGKLRTAFAEKNVLFVTADVTSAGSRHQARLLLTALSLGDAWEMYSKKPGTVVLTSPYGDELGRLTATMKEAEAKAALQKALDRKDEDGEEDDDGDDGG